MIHECPFPGCTYTTKDVTDELAAVVLKIHAEGYHIKLQQKPTKVENVRRPTVVAAGTSEDWSYFITRWNDYKIATNLSGVDIVMQLLECCEDSLRKDVTREAGGSLTAKTEDEVLQWMQMLAVRKENIMVARVELHDMRQYHDESIRCFGARVKGQASVCKHTVDCPKCSTEISYTNEVIKDIIVKGIYDSDIQLNLLSDNNKLMSLEDVLRFVEAKEMGKRSAQKLLHNAQGANSTKSHYQKARLQQVTEAALCSYCGKSGHGKSASLTIRKKQCGAFGKVCSHCGLKNHLANVCRIKAQGFSKTRDSAKVDNVDNNVDDVNECPVWEELCGVNCNSFSQNKSICLSHHIYKQMIDDWIKQPSQPQPSLVVTASTTEEDYTRLGYTPLPKHTSSMVTVMPDTGCQSCLAGIRLISALNIPRSRLIPVRLQMSAANRSSINILGAAIVRFSGSNKRANITTRQIVYITDSTDKIYLSKEACMELGIISRNFPTIGEVNLSVVTNTLNLIPTTKCDCPKRSLPPCKPTQMPFEVKGADDVERLKKWLLEYYKSSSFNTCEHQTLPKMDGPYLRLMIDEGSEPVPKHRPLPIPLHWMEKVKEGIDQDVRLGVIEPVPVGDPVTWCHWMVVCAKRNGKLRRTVDFQALNKFAKRETHHTQSPYIQARSVPSGKLKSVFDCWNGYHSIPLHPDDYHFTTFITPWGRYRYKVAPQGYIASGDGYCRRFDEIVSCIPHKTKCVDDTLIWGNSVKECFEQAVNWLDVCGRHGIILNPDKFVFAQSTVDFAGFTITKDSVKPASRYISAIRDFPTPSNITDVRSWFGLINQVAYTFAAAEIMNPFRDLLKSKTKFYWNEQLEHIFQQSKQTIINKIENGVKIFDKSKACCLATDWSKTGLGYWLLQKHCSCKPTKPFCCPTGWHVTLVGSRFTHSRESRYAPIEGEALAVVYALEHARHFVLGCDDLLIAVDHKPLLGLFETRSLNIDNNRLRNLKEKTLPYRFKMVHVSGARHKAPDAISRKPVGSISPPMLLLPDDVATDDEQQGINSLLSVLRPKTEQSDSVLSTINALNALQVVTWEKVKEATKADTDMELLLTMVETTLPSCKSEWPDELHVFFRYRNQLKAVDGVVLYNDRIIVPKSLQKDVLALLHSAHQGVTRMTARAEVSVFWPGISSDIEETRKGCSSCNRITPSQPSAPPAEIRHPLYPFQMICGDFFSYKGNAYLVIVDRFSNWPIIEKASEGSKGLINCLRKTFSIYGIPDEFASDGGLEFTSHATQSFLRDWGVHHRISSVGFPHSNCRAEIAVKTAKRMISENTDNRGNLEVDTFRRAILTYRNTPDPESGLSPAQCIFGRPIKDFIPVSKGRYNPHPAWTNMLNKREEALQNRSIRMNEVWTEHTKALRPLRVGDYVRVQNQIGPNPKRWEKTGVIMEKRDHDQYMVKIDGSSRATLRNRKFIRLYEPVFPTKPLPSSITPQRLSRHLPNNTISPDATATDHEGDGTGHSPGNGARTVQKQKVAYALRCLKDHNKPGLKEKH